MRTWSDHHAGDSWSDQGLTPLTLEGLKRQQHAEKVLLKNVFEPNIPQGEPKVRKHTTQIRSVMQFSRLL